MTAATAQVGIGRRDATAIFVVALIVRLTFTAVTQGLYAPPDGEANPDQIEYETIALNLAAGDGYSLDAGTPTVARPPGTPLTLVVPYLILGHSFLVGRLWLVLLSSVTCVLVARLTQYFGGRRVGVLAGLWLALYPGHFYYASHFLSEPVYGFWLVSAALLTLASLRSGRLPGALAAGVAWGAVILTRAEMAILLPVVALAIFAYRRRLERRVFRQLAWSVGVATFVVGIWVARNVAVFGTPTLSAQVGFVWWGAHNERTMTDLGVAGGWINPSLLIDDSHPLSGSLVERSQQASRYGTASIKDHWPRLPLVVAMKIWRFLSPLFPTDNMVALWVMAVGWIATAPFVGLGVWALARQRRQLQWPLLVTAMPVALTITTTAMFYGQPRFRDGISPLLVTFASAGLLHALGRLRSLPKSG